MIHLTSCGVSTSSLDARFGSGRALRFSALLLLAWLPASPLEAATWVVHPDGTGDAPTIQAAVDLAANGDTILLGPGTFTGPGNRGVLLFDRELTVTSTSGPDATILDCEGSDRAFRAAFGQLVFSGFTVRDGDAGAARGGAVRCEDSQVTLEDCVFEDCRADGPGGAVSGALIVEDCRFIGNSSESGAGALDILSLSGGVVTRCQFIGNTATVAGGAVTSWGPTSFTLCTFAGNSASWGGAWSSALVGAESVSAGRESARSPAIARAEPNATFVECTFAANESPAGAHLYVNQPVVLDRCILAFGSGAAVACGSLSPSVTVSCTDIFGNGGGDWTDCLDGQGDLNGNFSADPEFCGAPDLDFTLSSSSPCAPPGATGCGLIGAHPVACEPVSLEALGWSRVKALHRD